MDGIYPKVKWHARGGGSVLVTSAVQEKALGVEWIDNKLPNPVVKKQIVTQVAPQKIGAQRFNR